MKKGKKKICFIGGGSLHTKNWIKYFDKKKYSSYLLSVNKVNHNLKNIKVFELSSGIKAENKGKVSFKVKTKRKIYKLIKKWRWAEKIKLDRLLGNLPLISKAKRITGKINPDILVAYGIERMGYLALFLNYPLIVHTFGVDLSKMPSESKIHNYLTKKVLKKAKLIFTQSEPEKNLLINKFKIPAQKIAIGYKGINLNIFKPAKDKREIRKKLNLPTDRPVIISTRTASELFNLKKIINSIPKIRNKQKPLFIFFWPRYNPSYLREMKKIINKLQIERSVKILGSVEQKKLAYYLQASDILISVPDQDGVPNTLFECFATKNIPIFSKIPTVSEWIDDGKNGFLVDINKANDLSNKLNKALNRNNDKITKENYRLARKKCDYNKNMRKIARIYLKNY